jgi:hypothetical protein
LNFCVPVGFQRFETLEDYDLNESQNVLRVPFNNATLDDTGNRIGIGYNPLYTTGVNKNLFLCVVCYSGHPQWRGGGGQ